MRRYLADMIRNRGVKALHERSYLYRRLRTFLLYSALPLSGRYLWRIAYFNQEQKQKLFSEELNNILQEDRLVKGGYPFTEEPEFADFLTVMLYFDTKLFLPDDLLAKMDQMTMAYSLEGRVPFLDHKLVEFVASLPSKMKLYNRTSKYLLKKFISLKVPKEILTRPKQGLMPPIQKWLNKRLDDFFLAILNDRKTQTRGYFNQSFIKQMVAYHQKGKIDYSYQIWALTAFELWLRAFELN